MCVTLADGNTRAIASGTYPAKAGKTGVIPSARIRPSILCCSATCWLCQLSGSGPPHPCMLPIRDLQSHHNHLHQNTFIMCQLTVNLEQQSERNIKIYSSTYIRVDWKCSTGKWGTNQIKERLTRLENDGPNFKGRKMQQRKLQDWKMEDRTCGVENAGPISLYELNWRNAQICCVSLYNINIILCCCSI